MAFCGQRFPKIGIAKEWYSSTVELDFEGMKVSAPVGYDKVLTRSFKNYMEPKQNISRHDYPFFKNQKEYLEKIGMIYVE
jgi:lipopolysaccharide cholinephosphotransferase